MFGKRRKWKVVVNGFTDRAAGKIVKSIGWMQRAFAVFMNRRTRRFSRGTWLVLMVVFGTGWALLSGYFIVDALAGQADVRVSHPVRVIVGPKRNDSLSYWEEMYKQRKLQK